MRGGLERVVNVVHVVDPVSGMEGGMFRERVTSAQEITGSPVAGSTTPSAAATPAASAATAGAATVAVTGCPDRSGAAGQPGSR